MSEVRKCGDATIARQGIEGVSGAERRKGREGENESRAIFTRHGLLVTALQAGRTGRGDLGDFIVCRPTEYDADDSAILDDGFKLVCDSKRREKVRVVEWARAIEAIARPDETAVTVWRQSREPWRVTLLAEDFARLLTR